MIAGQQEKNFGEKNEPFLGDYNIYASTTSSGMVTLINSAERSFWRGAITIPSGASSLGKLIVASAGTNLWFQAKTGIIKSEVELTFNTSGSSSDGTTLYTPEPTAGSDEVWEADTAYYFGVIR